MGVPKFYRWISERYPCLSEVVKEYQIPEFDNLYLDMNGIIHNCSHPNDDDPHFRITEEKIFQDIFHYIEVLFRMIQPRKVFFMAVDGVAPRAKMNQQRGRRFRSAKEAEMNEKKAKDRGEKLPEEERFDSNCITPGTPFMTRLHEQLQYFVTMKISTDGLWKSTKVILSGHETPGEGEHKIMDYIRHEKSKDGYDPNTRHCLYGLDADLLMLGLCSHDPHFSLLREEVRFGGKKSQASKRTPTPEETTFHLLHLSLLREYLDYEFQELHSLPFYNLENIVDDWVLMGFLVGNDFIPNLPHMHINKGALPELYHTYKTVLPKLGGYLNEGGNLNVARFEQFMIALSQCELEKFDDIYSDSKWLEGKTAKKNNEGKTEVEPTPGPGHVHDLLEGEPEPGVNLDNKRTVNPDLQKLMDSTAEFDSDTDDDGEGGLEVFEDSTRGDFYEMEFRSHKRDYYVHKLGYSQVTPAVLREQAECYVRAIQWNLHYYYNGCVSWSWFYPHHFSPWITDIRDFSNMDLSYELSTPFKPFEQLLAVLPAASKSTLPSCFQWLMTSDESPIIDYYPLDFECDLNGKQQDWEAVVCIPFIDEKRLLSAMSPIYPKLSTEEEARNSHGPMWIGNYVSRDLERVTAPAYFPPVEKSHCEVSKISRDEWVVSIDKLRKGLMEGVKLDVYFPGFPTLKHIRHTARLSKTGVKVFEQSSRGENLMLRLMEQGKPDIKDVAKALLNKEVWVGWPHLVEARVVGVQSTKLYIDNKGERMGEAFDKLCNHIKHQYSNRWGVEVGDTEILVHACPMSGRKFVMGGGQIRNRITLEKQWNKISQPYALQAIVKDILVEDKQFKQYSTVEELFIPETTAFMLGTPHYGAQGTVIKIDPEHKGRIQLRFDVPDEPNLDSVKSEQGKVKQLYEPGFRAAQRLGITGHILSRITGTIFILRGAREQQADCASKSNIGLNLKFNKRAEEVCGYTKKNLEGGWEYSRATVDILRTYQENYPEVFEYLASNNNANNDVFHEIDVFGDTEKAKELATWLENLPTHTAPRQPFGTQTLDEEVVKMMEEEMDKLKDDGKRKEVVMQVRPHLLYLPNQYAGSSLVEAGTTFYLFDRVVNVREGFSVPLGLRGSVIRVTKGEKVEDNLYDVVFDEMFTGGLSLRCSHGRGYRLPGSALINITFKEGRKSRQEEPGGNKVKPRAVVRPYDEGRENGGRRDNPWERRNKNAPTGYGQPLPRDQENSLTFPPAPHNLPKPPSNMHESGGSGFSRGPNFSSEGHNCHPNVRGGAVSMGKGRGREAEKIQILRRDKSNHDSSENFQEMWQNMQEGTSMSVTEMESSLKTMLNISGSGSKDSSKVIPGGSNCRDLMVYLQTAGRPLPRYDYITDPTSGLVNSQISLDDGSMFMSDQPKPDREQASELAAGAALESLRAKDSRRNAPVRQTRGRGRGGRGKEGSRGEMDNHYQPWAQYVQGPMMEQPVKRPDQRRRQNDQENYHGTDQMDIRNRGNQQPAFVIGGEKVEQTFVPMQVSRKAVKTKEREESCLEKEEIVDGKEETGLVEASKETTPQRGRGGKGGRGGQRRKPRIAANFGGGFNPQ